MYFGKPRKPLEISNNSLLIGNKSTYRFSVVAVVVVVVVVVVVAAD